MTTLRQSSKSSSSTRSTSKASPSAPSSTATAASSPILIAPPPTEAVIPIPPNGVVTTDGSAYRGVLPRTAQLVVMSAAVEELGRFADYAQVFGRTAPALASITQSFDAANQWSLMRVRTIVWGSYCLQQEGLAWIDVRNLMDKLQPAFELAVAADASIGTQFPNLVKLFNALRTIAQAGAATKKANKKAQAEGKPPTKGKVGKQRQRAAERAALLTASPSASTPATTVAASPSAPVAVGTAATATNGSAHS
jgi:hypothetical protein